MPTWAGEVWQLWIKRALSCGVISENNVQLCLRCLAVYAFSICGPRHLSEGGIANRSTTLAGRNCRVDFLHRIVRSASM